MGGGVVLGVDGGNTKTLALVASLDGRIVGAGRAGCSDVYTVGEEAATGAVAAAAGDALAAAGARGGDVVAAVLSLAGADWPEDFALHEAEARRRLGLAVAPRVLNDAIGALRCGAPDGVGVAVVCGTGGAVGARNALGATFHLGFWPDGTGGGALGRAALRAVERAGLGLDPETALTAAVLERYGVADTRALLHVRTGRHATAPAPSTLAPLVLDVAAAGDAVARAIVAAQGTVLGEYARVASARVGLVAGFRLVLAGGVLRHASSGLLVERLLAGVPDAEPVQASIEPASAAVLTALEAAGATPDESAVRATEPPASFFHSAG